LSSFLSKVPAYASACPECSVVVEQDYAHVKNAGCRCGPGCVFTGSVFIYIHLFFCCFPANTCARSKEGWTRVLAHPVCIYINQPICAHIW